MTTRWRRALCAIGLLGLGLSGCGGDGGKQPGPGAGSSAGDVRIGVVHPLSGPLAPYGKAAVNGIRMRVDEVNAAGGVSGRKIRIFV